MAASAIGQTSSADESNSDLTPISIGIMLELAPYTSSDADDGGMLTHIIDEILAEAGYQVDIKFTEQPGAIETIREAGLAVAFPFLGTVQSEDDFFVSNSIYDMEIYAYAGDRSLAAARTFEDLQDRRLCHASWIIAEELKTEDPGNNLSIQSGETIEDCFDALGEQVVDVVLADRLNGDRIIHQKRLWQSVRSSDEAVHTIELKASFWKLSRHSRILAYEFDEILATMREAGKVELIEAKYARQIHRQNAPPL